MSGLSHHPGKVAQGLPCREFESLSLRQKLVLSSEIKPSDIIESRPLHNNGSENLDISATQITINKDKAMAAVAK